MTKILLLIYGVECFQSVIYVLTDGSFFFFSNKNIDIFFNMTYYKLYTLYSKVEVIQIELTERQLKIIDIVKTMSPLRVKILQNILNLTRATLRPDLSILTMSKVLYARPKVGYFYGDITGIGLSLKETSKKTVRDANERSNYY